jgi:peroxiredoxin Q/BCP
MLQPGTAFPQFSLPNQDGKITKLSDFKGQWLVIYFYPKDDTPGCTTQGRAFTASKADYDKAGVTVLGVSQDDVTSHKNFHHKFAFKIDLLSDVNAELIKAVGLGQHEWRGFTFWDRTSFIVDPEGIIRKVYEQVNPEGHERVLLDDIEALRRTAAA